MTEDRELVAIMRRAMAGQASHASDSNALAERIIHAAGATSTRQASRPSRLRPWVMPLLAAALIVLVAGSVIVGVRSLSSGGSQPGTQPQPAPITSSQPAPTGSSSPTSSQSASPTSSPSVTGSRSTPVPVGFRVLDLTWVSLDDGWALGTVPCGSTRCELVVRTTDGGTTWGALPSPDFTQGATRNSCVAVCVTNIRFADTRTGYAFGGNYVYMTTDGGGSWQPQPLPAGLGGATVQVSGLEIANGTVLRLTLPCLPGCAPTMQRSTVGSTVWQDVALPSGASVFGAQLARAGHAVVVLTLGHVAGGASSAASHLFASTDDGTTWRSIPEPCPALPVSGNQSSEADTADVAVTGDGTLSTLCVARQQGVLPALTVLTSGNGGASFTEAAASPPGAAFGPLAAASATDLSVSTTAGVMHSADAGNHWTRVLPPMTYLGFESPLVGRAFARPTDGMGSATVWTTHDGGATWQSFTFPG